MLHNVFFRPNCHWGSHLVDQLLVASFPGQPHFSTGGYEDMIINGMMVWWYDGMMVWWLKSHDGHCVSWSATRRKPGGRGIPLCGGALISSRWKLLNAHRPLSIAQHNIVTLDEIVFLLFGGEALISSRWKLLNSHWMKLFITKKLFLQIKPYCQTTRLKECPHKLLRSNCF